MNFIACNLGMPQRWLPPKILLIMKLVIVILIAGFMQVNAAGFAQRITLSETNSPLATVLNKIKIQSGKNVFFSDDILKNAKKVNVKIFNLPLEEALDKVLKDQPLSYEIKENTIVILEKEVSFLDKVMDVFGTNKQSVIRGKVLDETGKPLPGAVVKVKGTGISMITNNDGEFIIKDIKSKTILQISYIGYRPKEYAVLGTENMISINMELLDNKLEEVNIVSTGYQKLPKERATGSFELVDKELLNRSPGTDVISRLKGVTASTIFGNTNNIPLTPNPQANSVAGRRKTTTLQQLTIRGISSLETSPGNMDPLVVLDNFQYEGDVNNINPNDIESITLLKDAAAASIWGIRASNGVIVITTKKAKYDQPVRVSLNSNVTIGEKPDLFYINRISSSDYIDIEKMLFAENIYDDRISNPLNYPLSPVVELLNKQRSLPIGDVLGRAAIDQQIDALRKYDIRNDLLKYVYKESVNQQYAINVSGGGKNMSYLLSGGYDNNKASEIEIGYKRLSLRSSLTFNPIKNLEIQSDIFYTGNKYYSPANEITNGRILQHLPPTPYTRLADENGEHLELVNPVGTYIPSKSSYRSSAGNGRLLDWIYKPLDDIGTTTASSKNQNVLMNLGLNYKISPSFIADVNYQYGKNTEEGEETLSVNSFAMRDFINTFAQYSTTNLTLAPTFNIPVGGSYFKKDYFSISNNLRGKVNFAKVWRNVHDINAIAGMEIREVIGYGTPVIQLYGYKPDPLSGRALDYNLRMPYLNDPENEGYEIFLPKVEGLTRNINRNTSLFMNAAYSYLSKYTLSASLRKDASNLFGVKVNQRGQPSWSIGASWNITNESFFKLRFIENLKLRATYGYLGNVNNTVSAYPTIQYESSPIPSTLFNYATFLNPPNQDLRPERSGIANFGIDFTLKGSRLSGSIEYYDKRSENLIAPTPLDLTTGFTSLNVNSANVKTTGFDLNLRSINVQTHNFQWMGNLLFSYTHNLVTKYLLPRSDFASAFVPLGTGSIPQRSYIQGSDPFSLYTYRFAGLDPNTGDPMGYLDGQLSTDYTKLTAIKLNELENHGSIIPLYYGSFRNDFTWKRLTLSANILFKFDYKLSVPGINYSGLLSTTGNTVLDFDKRWQKPGDEKNTNIPSLKFPADANRDFFYNASSARVISGNHIRLQDIRVTYSLKNLTPYIKDTQIYGNVNNLGIIWKANKMGIDPDVLVNSFPAPKIYTLGLNVGF